MKIVVYDFETYFDSKSYTLSKMSAIEYIRDQRFYALCMGYSINGSQPVVVDHDQIPETLAALDLTNSETLLIGHNSAGFDNLILSEIYNIHPAFMTDTIHMMRWSGLSRISGESLASLAKCLSVGVKRKGTVMSDGLRRQEDFAPDVWEDFKKYCSEDVWQTGQAVAKLMPYLTLDAIKFSSLSCKMATEPGFIVVPEPLQVYLQALAAKKAEALATLKKTFQLPDDESFLSEIRSTKKFAAMLKLLGCEPPLKLSEKKTAARKKKLLERGNIPVSQITSDMYEVWEPAVSKTDLEFLALLEHPDIRVRELVQIRLDHNSSVAETRANNLLAMAAYNKPMPIMLKCYYAHTSRYGAGTTEGKSDGLNIQNLPKHNKAMKALRQAIVVPSGYKVVACDSSQIEARCLAYEANFVELLEHFKNHRDPYAEMAAKFGFGPTAQEIHDGAKHGDRYLKTLRQAGKKCILSAGYGVGAQKYANSLWQEGVHLGETKSEHDEIAAQAHRIYRQSSAPIVQFWDTCKHVIQYLSLGQSGAWGGPNEDLFTFGMETLPDGTRVPSIKLPSAYYLRYPNLQKDINDNAYYYDRRLGKNLVKAKAYGGAITENCTQAFAFQILLWQACCMEESGIKLYANIHDSFATIVPEEQAESTAEKMVSIMRTLPEWAHGLPVDAEAEIGDDFSIV